MEMGGRDRITAADFARLVGVSGPAISLAIKSGRLKNSVELQANGRQMIDPVIGRVEWEANRQRGARNGPKEPEAPAMDPLSELERRQKFYQAEISRLKFEQQSGLLIPTTQVNRQAFASARAVRDALLALPARLSAEFAGEQDAFQIATRLEEEIRSALENLSAQIEAAPEPEVDAELDLEPEPVEGG